MRGNRIHRAIGALSVRTSILLAVLTVAAAAMGIGGLSFSRVARGNLTTRYPQGSLGLAVVRMRPGQEVLAAACPDLSR